MTLYSLSEDEVLLLDGKVNEDVQKSIDKIKSRRSIENTLDIPEKYKKFVAEKIRVATDTQELRFTQGCKLSSCNICGKKKTYRTYTRNTKYHRKGEPNYDRPIDVYGVNLGCCSSCWKEVRPYLGKALEGVEAEISKTITGKDPEYKKYANIECSVCGWEGHEGEMGMLPALMGGSYRGKCPKCGAKNIVFVTKIKRTKGYTLVKVEETK